MEKIRKRTRGQSTFNLLPTTFCTSVPLVHYSTKSSNYTIYYFCSCSTIFVNVMLYTVSRISKKAFGFYDHFHFLVYRKRKGRRGFSSPYLITFLHVRTERQKRWDSRATCFSSLVHFCKIRISAVCLLPDTLDYVCSSLKNPQAKLQRPK